MKRKPLYSRASKRRSGSSANDEGTPVAWSFEEEQGPSLAVEIWQKAKTFAARHDRSLPAIAAVLVAVGLIGGWQWFHPGPAALTQWDIDNAVKYTLGNTPPGPAETTVAAATVGPSVVRVDGFLSPEHAAQEAKVEAAEARKSHLKATPAPMAPKASDGKDKDKDKDEHPDSTGTGVVIDEKGDILTNLHVIHSTDRWVVTFFDGSKSEATVVNVQPENDLAVIRTKTQPDDLKPATLASTANLFPGDTVVAVGFPFGIGPSVSSGVVAGLKREFDDPTEKDKPTLTNLIQFTAAVNPGNSGGPLVNRDGEVVGIVTAIYNPTGQRVFAGMAFAVPIENAAKAVGNNPL
jgi:serine protease DegQ